MAEQDYYQQSCARIQPYSSFAAVAAGNTYHTIVTFVNFVNTAETTSVDRRAGRRGLVAAVGSRLAFVTSAIAADAVG